MKRIIFTILTMLIFILTIISCKPGNKEQAEIEKLKQETNSIDSLSVEIEKSQKEIEETTKEVDKLLEEL